MAVSKTIKSETPEQEKTGSEIENLEKEPTKIRSLDKPTGEDFEYDLEEKTSTNNRRKLTPLEAAKKSRDEQEARKNKNIADLFAVLKWLIPAAIAILGIYWAYNISSIAEPIGGIKNEIQHLRKDTDALQADLKELNNSVKSNNITSPNTNSKTNQP